MAASHPSGFAIFVVLPKMQVQSWVPSEYVPMGARLAAPTENPQKAKMIRSTVAEMLVVVVLSAAKQRIVSS